MRLGSSVVGLVLASLVTLGQAPPAVVRGDPEPVPDRTARVEAAGPLAGKVVVLDAGHQLGNHNYPRQINRLVPAGGFKKACNTTGTSTNGGYPEATFTFRVTALLKARLERRGRGGHPDPDRPTARTSGAPASTSAAGPATRSAPTSRSASTPTGAMAAARASTSSRRPTASPGPTTSTSPRDGWPRRCAPRCGTPACRRRATSPAATASTSGATWARSTSPTSRRSWSSRATCAPAPTPGG